MYNIIVILIIIVCVLLALVVLVQNSKGGGLAANFSAPTQVMGVRQTADFLEKATWWLAGALVVLSLIATVSIGHSNGEDPMQTEVKVSDVAPTTQAPAATVPVPVEMPAEEQ
jgi:preprotein translocase subunit SecG